MNIKERLEVLKEKYSSEELLKNIWELLTIKEKREILDILEKRK